MPSAVFSPFRTCISTLSSPSRALCLRSTTVIRTFKAFRKQDHLDSDALIVHGRKPPPYPYGARQTFHQADRGLYGGAQLQFGNKISKGRNKGKTRRRWYPNVRLETIRSEALGKDLTIRITASCMRTIKKCGGLDQYLLGDKPARIKELGLFGWQLRWKVMNSAMMRKEFSQQRSALMMEGEMPWLETFQEAWRRTSFRHEFMRSQTQAWAALRERDEKFKKHVKTKWEPADKTDYDNMEVMVPDAERHLSALPL